MPNYCFTVPLNPGGEEMLMNWIRDGIKNNADHDRIFQEAGVSREQVWIQRTPMGNFAVVSLEVRDPQKAFETIARSSDPWAVKYRDFLKRAHGLDMTQPAPINEQILNWQAKDRVHT